MVVLKHGDIKDYDNMLVLLGKTDLHEEKMRILCSLGAVTSKDLIQRVLKLSISVSILAIILKNTNQIPINMISLPFKLTINKIEYNVNNLYVVASRY